MSRWEKIHQALDSQRHPFASGPVAQLGARFHGMEEVAGSIPARSTKLLNKSDGAVDNRRGVCGVLCVITCRSGAALRFHPNVTEPFQPSAE
jgi:hypothetical protein